jgi:hypothetical protein
MGRRRSGAPPISLFSFQDIITSVTGIMILVTLMMSIELVRQRYKGGQVQVSRTHIEQFKATLAEAQAEINDLNARRQRGTEILRDMASVSALQLQEESRELRRLVAQLATEAADLQLKAKDAQCREDDAERVMRNSEQSTAQLKKRVENLRDQIARLKKQNRVIYNPAGSEKSTWLVEINEDRLTVAPLGKVAAPIVFEHATRADDFLSWARSRDLRTEYFLLLIKPDSGIMGFKEIHLRLHDAGFDVGYDLLSPGQTAIDPKTGAATLMMVD